MLGIVALGSEGDELAGVAGGVASLVEAAAASVPANIRNNVSTY